MGLRKCWQAFISSLFCCFIPAVHGNAPPSPDNAAGSPTREANAAATKIQAAVRGFLARLNFKRALQRRRGTTVQPLDVDTHRPKSTVDGDYDDLDDLLQLQTATDDSLRMALAVHTVQPSEVLALVSGFTAIAQPLIITTTPMLPEGDLNCEDTMLFPALRTRKAPVALAAPPNLALPTAPLQQEKENPHLAIVLAPARPLAATHTPGDKRKRGGDAQQVVLALTDKATTVLALELTAAEEEELCMALSTNLCDPSLTAWVPTLATPTKIPCCISDLDMDDIPDVPGFTPGLEMGATSEDFQLAIPSTAEAAASEGLQLLWEFSADPDALEDSDADQETIPDKQVSKALSQGASYNVSVRCGGSCLPLVPELPRNKSVVPKLPRNPYQAPEPSAAQWGLQQDRPLIWSNNSKVMNDDNAPGLPMVLPKVGNLPEAFLLPRPASSRAGLPLEAEEGQLELIPPGMIPCTLQPLAGLWASGR